MRCMKLKERLFFALLAVFCALQAAPAPQAAAPLPIWKMPAVWPQHLALRQQLMDVLRRGDIVRMEAICREALKLLPGDATWQYNLACALAYREKPDAALDALDLAVTWGFRDANAIENDRDFLRIRHVPRFEKIVARAKETAALPVAGRPLHSPALAPFGGTLTLTETNLVWDFESGLYQASVKLQGANAPSPLAGRYGAQRPDAPERPYLAAWLSEGTAAGNGGDLYVNLDRKHANLNTADFPLLTRVDYCDDARKANIDVNHPLTLFPGRFTLVNASRAQVGSPFWRSLARASMTDSRLAQRMHTLYLNNQLTFFPANKDFGVPEIGDVFPAAAPFQFVSQGASWSDLPFLRAAFAATAALRPDTKEAILSRRLGGPTLQWLLRRATVASDEAYLTAQAHPSAFAPKSLDAKALVQHAHALKPDDIPPAALLTPVSSRLFPVQMPVAGADYADALSEFLYITPSACCIVLRGTAALRTFLFTADSFPEKDDAVTYAWRVVNGDAGAVKIEQALGEKTRDPARGLAQITIDRSRLLSRVDIAVFARRANTAYGAPSFISFFPIPSEKRVYDEAKRLVSIDYTNAENVYCDPLIALPRRWKDVYDYAPDGRRLGFTRYVGAKAVASFTTQSERIVEKRRDGRPKSVVRVKYIPRKTAQAYMPYELTYVDEGQPFTLKN